MFKMPPLHDGTAEDNGYGGTGREVQAKICQCGNQQKGQKILANPGVVKGGPVVDVKSKIVRTIFQPTGFQSDFPSGITNHQFW